MLFQDAEKVYTRECNAGGIEETKKAMRHVSWSHFLNAATGAAAIPNDQRPYASAERIEFERRYKAATNDKDQMLVLLLPVFMKAKTKTKADHGKSTTAPSNQDGSKPGPSNQSEAGPSNQNDGGPSQTKHATFVYKFLGYVRVVYHKGAKKKAMPLFPAVEDFKKFESVIKAALQEGHRVTHNKTPADTWHAVTVLLCETFTDSSKHGIIRLGVDLAETHVWVYLKDEWWSVFDIIATLRWNADFTKFVGLPSLAPAEAHQDPAASGMEE